MTKMNFKLTLQESKMVVTLFQNPRKSAMEIKRLRSGHGLTEQGSKVRDQMSVEIKMLLEH